jgi:hypothetical protein
MSIIFVVLSRMSPTLEFEYHGAQHDMSESTKKII